MFGFSLYRVRGQSMTPTLSPGDIVLLRLRSAKRSDIVVVDHPRYKRIIKRIDKKGQLSGDNPDSTPSADLGAYDPATLIGVAILAVTPSGLQRLSARRSGTRA